MGLLNATTSSHDESKHDESPRLCTRGCGFFGSEEYHGCCSKCHKEFNNYINENFRNRAESNSKGHNEQNGYIKRKPEERPKATCDEAVVHYPRHDRTILTHIQKLIKKKKPAAASKKKNNNKNRCECCNKKVGLLGFSCRCGGTFCGSHRYPESHPCDFDFKTYGKMKIEKENLVIKADKLSDRL